MSEKLSKLLSMSSNAIADPPTMGGVQALAGEKSVGLKQELCSFLADKNGFFSFESALVVRPLDYDQTPLGILQWNNPAVWRADYKTNIGESVFFAEDIFGIQFCIRDDSVNTFDPETGRFTKIAETLEDWAGWILEDHSLRTGWALAHQWQVHYGPLLPGTRLLPKIPFVCGGQFLLDNLYLNKDVDGMRFRASLANQLVNVPDGTEIVIKIKRNS